MVNVRIMNREKLNKEMIDDLIENIQKEMKFQNDKFPKQNHTFEMWYLILMEEITEISQEYLKFLTKNDLYNDYDYSNVRKEIIQSITLLVQMCYGLTSFDFNDNINLRFIKEGMNK